jgi:hypothetical protein
VLAGALTAGIVVVLLRLFAISQTESPAESATSSGTAPLAILAALGETDEPGPHASMPTGIAPPLPDLAAENTAEPATAAAPRGPAAEGPPAAVPPAAVPPAAAPPAEGRPESPSAAEAPAVIGDRTSRVATPPRGANRRVPRRSSPAPNSAAALIAEARAALLRGNARECLETVDRALSGGGGSTALRLQGDCHLRDGNRIEAAKAYQRFCRLAPDHPAIGEVRNLVESLGGACP